MSTAATRTPVTPAEFEQMSDAGEYELVAGRLVERHMGSESSWVAGQIFGLLWTHCRQTNAGSVWPADNGYQCFSDSPNTVRKPDVSFIRKGRLPDERPSRGFEQIVPDLVVEVISPNDLASRIDEKVDQFLRAGTALVWVVNPDRRTVAVYRKDGTTVWLREDDELDGEETAPGFRCKVSDVFPKPSAEKSDGDRHENTDG